MFIMIGMVVLVPVVIISTYDNPPGFVPSSTGLPIFCFSNQIESLHYALREEV